jgi:hypothetical protein
MNLFSRFSESAMLLMLAQIENWKDADKWEGVDFSIYPFLKPNQPFPNRLPSRPTLPEQQPFT